MAKLFVLQVKVVECDSIGRCLDRLVDFYKVVEQSLFGEEVGVEGSLDVVNHGLLVEHEGVAVAEGELAHLHIACALCFVDFHLEVAVWSGVLFRKTEHNCELVQVGQLVVANLVFSVEEHPFVGCTCGLAGSDVSLCHSINLPCAPVTVVPAFVVGTGNELIVFGSDFARGLHDEECTTGCLAI